MATAKAQNKVYNNNIIIFLIIIIIIITFFFFYFFFFFLKISFSSPFCLESKVFPPAATLNNRRANYSSTNVQKDPNQTHKLCTHTYTQPLTLKLLPQSTSLSLTQITKALQLRTEGGKEQASCSRAGRRKKKHQASKQTKKQATSTTCSKTKTVKKINQ